MASVGRSPVVEKVPFELWDEILKLAHNEKERPADSPTAHPTTFPALTFSHVSAKWRAVAISIPKFWTEISIGLFNENEGRVRTHFPDEHLLHLFLERSRDEPLTVKIKVHGLNAENKEQMKAYNFLIMLFRNTPRWRAASIYLAFGNIDEYWWDLLEFIIDNRGFSTLESLDIQLGPQPLADEELGTVKIPCVLWDSPALKRLAITMEKVDLPDGMDAYCNIVVAPRWALKTRIPYHQPTHLLLDVRDEADLTWTELHKIFSMARNVVCAFFSGIKPHLPDQRRGQPPAHPIRLEHLRHLYLQIPGDPFDAYIGCRLDTRLIAPSLKTLAIVGEFVDWDQHEYNTFMTRSGFDLQELYLAIPDTTLCLSEQADCIHLSTNVKTVHLDWGRYQYNHDDNPLNFATHMGEWDEDSSTPRFRLCPQLEVLSLRHPEEGIAGFMRANDNGLFGEALDMNAFAEMLKKRCLLPSGCRGQLKTLMVPSEVLEDEVVMNHLSCLRDDPWNLDIVDNESTLDMRTLWRCYGGEF